MLAGLNIIERHSHSIDIYTDKTKYAEKGTDATVVYGYKDLRIKNNQDYSIQFGFEIGDDHITIILRSEKQIVEQVVKF